MSVTSSPSIPVLVKETRNRLGLTQLQFAIVLGVSFQSVNRWEWSKTKPLPIVLKQIEVMVKEMGDGREANRLRHRGSDLLEQYFCPVGTSWDDRSQKGHLGN